MPRLSRLRLDDRRAVCACSLAAWSLVESLPDLSVLRLIASNLVYFWHVTVRSVDALFKPFERLHGVAHRARTKESRKERDLADAPTRSRRRWHLFSKGCQLRLPDRGVAALARRNGFKRGASLWILLDRCKSVIQIDRISLKGEPSKACGAVFDLLHGPSLSPHPVQRVEAILTCQARRAREAPTPLHQRSPCVRKAVPLPADPAARLSASQIVKGGAGR